MSNFRSRSATWGAAAVFVAVLVVQLAFVAHLGTDVPFHDQWPNEGQWLYPKVCDGDLAAADLARPWNEHRIAWTHALNAALFVANGQWDPLVQIAAIGVLRAGVAALVAWVLIRTMIRPAAVPFIVGGVVLAFLPHLAWHAVLWGFESQVYFALGFSLVALVLLSGRERSVAGQLLGVGAAGAGMFAMGPALLVPAALLVWAAIRAGEERDWSLIGRRAWAAWLLLILALFVHVEASGHAELRANAPEFILAAGRLLAWPHVAAPPAALIVNLPIALIVWLRITRQRSAAAGEDGVLAIAVWSVCVALATAWARGGSAELSSGVPSRYVDFLILGPLANLWAAWTLARERSAQVRFARHLAAGCTLFVFVGWLGLSAEVVRGIVLPRAADRDAPVRLIQAYQQTGDALVFEGQPRLLVPNPNLAAVRSVLMDPRLRGKLPPSLQPEKPMGPLSKAVRGLLRHERPWGP
jgi:hypothetical protein